MRPLLLELTGFRSYDRARVDWSAHDLVVIGGATGSGKTSLLDAIAFALFGRTPESTRTGDLLRLGDAHGEVRLEFGLREERWRVTRRFGPAAPEPAQALERLAPGEAITVAVGEGPVGERIGELLGMSFDAFTSTVLLAQGRFARFLRAQPAERDAILRELFSVASLEGVRAAALAARDAARARATALAEERARLAAHRPGVLAASARDARRAAARRAAARSLAPIADEVVRATADAAAARGGAETLDATLAQLPDRATRAALAADRDDAAAALARAAAARDLADAARTRAAAACEEARARHGADAAGLGALREAADTLTRLDMRRPGLEAHAQATAAEAATRRGHAEAEARSADRALAGAAAAQRHRDARARAVAAEAEVERTERTARDADRAARAAQAALDETRRRVTGARAEREGAERAHAAAHLRAALDVGDSCPVCGGVVGADSPAPAPERERLEHSVAGAEADMAHAERAERDAGEAAVAARARHDAALARAAVASAEIPPGAGDDAATSAAVAAAARAEAARRAADAAAAEAGASAAAAARALTDAEGERARLAARLGTWAAASDPAGAIGRAQVEVASLEERLREAEAEARRAADVREVAASRMADLDAGPLRRLAGAVAALTDRLGHPRVEPSPTALLAAADEVEVTATSTIADARARADAAAARAASAAEILRGRGAELGVDAPGDLPAALRAADGALADARGRLREVVHAMREARRLLGEERRAGEEASHADQVAIDLRANRFPRFLLQRYRERLATSASARLEELSRGVYRFSGVGADPLAIVDRLHPKASRPASTLSGGEAFLASLALALGLGDVAAGSGGRLDCLFLDEGFSTLDEDSLEVALAAVERLAGGGRLVGVITHIPGVADRLGAEIRVRKDAAGTSRVVVAASDVEGVGASA